MNKKISSKKLLAIIRNFSLIVFLLVLGGAAGYRLGRDGRTLGQYIANDNFPQVVSPNSQADLDLFWYVWNLLESKYLDSSKINKQEMIYGAISGMVSALDDPYTVFLAPEQNKVTQEDLSGEFGGVGIQLGYKDGVLAVVSPLDNTPAKDAGVKAGDKILGIKDELNNIDITTEELSLPEAVQIIRGKAGTKISLTLFRDGVDEAFEVEIERGVITVPTVVYENIEKNGKTVSYVQVYRFSQSLEEQWFDWLDSISSLQNDPNFGGVIMDLRNNPGGYLNGAVFLASEFLSSGVVVEQEYSNGHKEIYKINRKGKLTDVPLVVLVNEGSASASEILAGSLQKHKRAILVGETTFGKGTVQEPQDLPGDSGLHITVSRWLLPGGVSIDKTGVGPDIEQEDKLDEQGNDLILERALQEIVK
jgi:carboxyl-terminal processing protease